MRLVAGQAVRVPPMPATPEKAAIVVTPGESREMERLVLYRDDQVIVLNKPSGLATQGGPGITGETAEVVAKRDMRVMTERLVECYQATVDKMRN